MSNSKLTRDFNNIIPQEISSEVKITKGLTMRAIIVIVLTLFVTEQFSFIVHPKLKLLYNIFCIGIGICMILPSSKNPGKQFYETLLLSAFKNMTVYHPIEREEIDNEE